MALIKTLSEVQELLPKLVSSLSDDALLPDFTSVEAKFIVPIIGATLYDALVTAYDNNTLDAEETKLVKKLRLVIAANAYKDDLGLYVVTLGDSGAKKISQGGATPIYGWEMQRLENTLREKALDGVDILLDYLFENKALYPEWTASEQYTKIKNLLIRTSGDFNQQYSIFRPSRTFFIIRSIIFDVQQMFLEETIGKEMLVYLRDKSTPTADEKECIDLLKKSLAFYSVMKAAKHFSVSFTDGGFTILGEKSSNSMENAANQTVDLQLLEMKMEECDKEGDAYLELSRSKLVALYAMNDATNDFKAAFTAGPLINYIQQTDRTSGNEERKIYVLP